MYHFSRLDISFSYRYAFRLPTGFLCMHMLWAVTAYSQRMYTSLGAVSDVVLSYSPAAVAIGSSLQHEPEIAVASDQQGMLYLYRVEANGKLVQTNAVRCPKQPGKLLATNHIGKGIARYVSLSSDGLAVMVFTPALAGMEVYVFPLKNAAQSMAIADVNNDKRRDVLLFGKNRSGVSTLIGKTDGTFGEGPVLFPEVSVCDLKATDLNGDGITDLFVLDWLSNHLSLFYGIGKMFFSEQVTVNLPEEPSEIAATEVSREREVRLAITFPESHTIRVYTGNSLGEFRQTSSLHCKSSPSRVAFTRINGDVFPEIVTAADATLLVALGGAKNVFDPFTEFGTSVPIHDWTYGDVDGDAKPDIALVQRSQKRLMVMANANASGPTGWAMSYAVGNGAAGLSVRDLNGDGFPDVAVANSSESSLSILFNKGQGRLDGQQTISVAEFPHYVRTAALGTNAARTLIVSHPDLDQITIVKLADITTESEWATLPTGPRPYVLFARENAGRLIILVRNVRPGGAVTLSSFEQLDGGQFLERSLQPIFPAKVTALTLDDVTLNGKYDLLFATSDQASHRTSISLGIADSSIDFRTVRFLFSYPDSSVATNFLLSGYLTRKMYKDIVIGIGPPHNEVLIAYGTGAGTFRDSLKTLQDINPSDDDDVIVKDVDNDDNTDIVYLDRTRKAVMALYGTGNGGFRTPVFVASAEDVNSIRVAPMKQQNIQDLVLSNGKAATVSVILRPFRR